MNPAPENNRSPLSPRDAGSAQARGRPRLLDRTNLPHSASAYEVEGDDRGGLGASVIVVDAPPGSGPMLHKHPYAEIFAVLEGQATFMAGEEVIEAVGGQVVVVPAGVRTGS